MNGEVPSVPITTLAGIQSLTDRKCSTVHHVYMEYDVHYVLGFQCCRNTPEFCQTWVWQNSRFCQTEQNFVGPNFFFHKAYNFVHIMIVGLNISMFCSKTNGQSDSSKIQCYLLFKCHLSRCGASKSKAWRRDGRTDRRNDNYFSDKNDTPDRHCLIVWRSRRSRWRSSASACLMSFDHLQVPDTAGGISNRKEWPLCAICFLFCFVLSLFHLWICFSLRLFLFCQGCRHFFAGYELPSSIFFFRSENFCRTFGPVHWRFLSDILKKCPIVRQVRRISTALGFDGLRNQSSRKIYGLNS